MIDIHCHLLYGVDDGAKTIEESVAMLEAAKEQGISAMILTPVSYTHLDVYKRQDIEVAAGGGKIQTGFIIKLDNRTGQCILI